MPQAQGSACWCMPPHVVPGPPHPSAPGLPARVRAGCATRGPLRIYVPPASRSGASWTTCQGRQHAVDPRQRLRSRAPEGLGRARARPYSSSSSSSSSSSAPSSSASRFRFGREGPAQSAPRGLRAGPDHVTGGCRRSPARVGLLLTGAQCVRRGANQGSGARPCGVAQPALAWRAMQERRALPRRLQRRSARPGCAPAGVSPAPSSSPSSKSSLSGWSSPSYSSGSSSSSMGGPCPARYAVPGSASASSCAARGSRAEALAPR
jgi:hypothetical protein